MFRVVRNQYSTLTMNYLLPIEFESLGSDKSRFVLKTSTPRVQNYRSFWLFLRTEQKAMYLDIRIHSKNYVSRKDKKTYSFEQRKYHRSITFLMFYKHFVKKVV
jgi:hypothetical protein